ncbi:hypothetical protein L202_02899 [Cryptococcus amylolentus CBS 6039]|uniref:Uncharacterized protein n=1 Tax=Cryptococcus amylolentus CBS 6039 TaxID=1295533 RepID=A0A1E3HWP9_9TREE|nr:hypothetical protein L202_02899 [Cryptococcus amylolentus CBS 6039]ODN80742.1 hypothetical protein L202_02899 [Cryptococcus amylolentus CBS 6039]
MASHDYTDSESEETFQPMDQETDIPPSGPPNSGPTASTEDGSLKVTVSIVQAQLLAMLIPYQIRPNMGQQEGGSNLPTPRSKHKHSSVAERANYSSSEDEGDKSATSPPRKKKKLSTVADELGSKGKQSIKLTFGPQHSHLNHASPPSSPSLTGKKSYDWLTPSVAGASHTGPPERGTSSRGTSPATESAADEAIGGLLDSTVEKASEKAAVKRSHHKKKAPDAPPGPGRAWKKGLKKALAAKMEDGTPTGTHFFSAPVASREPSPDPLALPAPHLPTQTVIYHPPIAPRALSPSFVSADASALGFPVYSNPIVPPRINLSAFPKVTNFFAPINGGDSGPFPRRERVRNWGWQEKGIVGIGGGVLKFKSWARGPTSELEKALVLEKERESHTPARPVKAKSTAATTPQPSTTAATPGTDERPALTPSRSFDKGSGSPGPGDDESDTGSEDIGAMSTPASKKGGPKKKGKTPKSKLAQEIVMEPYQEFAAGTSVQPAP